MPSRPTSSWNWRHSWISVAYSRARARGPWHSCIKSAVWRSAVLRGPLWSGTSISATVATAWPCSPGSTIPFRRCAGEQAVEDIRHRRDRGGFLDDGAYAAGARMIRPIRILATGGDNHGRLGVDRQNLLREFQPAHARHGHVCQHETELPRACRERLQRLRRVREARHRMTEVLEHTRHQVYQRLFVIQI